MKIIFQITFFISLFFLAIESFAQSFNGYTLYAKQSSSTVYLIDENASIAKTWSCSGSSNYAVALKDNGNIIRGVRNNGNALNGAAIAGKVQEVDPTGATVWEFVYSSSTYCTHHDICAMPNGNVLLIAWEVKTPTELTQAGYANATSDKWPPHIIEVQQNGTGGQIVWEWHMWDHMIQDHDPSKDNYGVVANNPQLMDINAITSGGGGGGPGGGGGGPGGGNGDWFHVNGIDYNPTLDQIVFSARHAHEIYVIDHSTTTVEAAGHTGGNSGKGGDLLYRWGNPSNYGASGTQTITNAVHDPRWILPGRPNEGYIQFFNNSGGSGGSSVVDAINPPLNGYTYTLTSGQAYSPSTQDWRHDCLANSSGQSASDRMSNGNTFVALSNQYMYEVDSNGTQVWAYPDDPAKAFRYECDHPGLAVLLGANPCGLPTGVNEIDDTGITLYPNPSTGVVTLDGVSEINLSIAVFDLYGRLISEYLNQSSFDLSAYPSGMYYVSIKQGDTNLINKKVTLIK
ncbi:MAG: aryl-sulfate sulfotransferase [Saprospiraceae bacterium]|nr:aryl-sulfate sulfotransferase [Saprospiraceae bacterium]